MNTTQQPIFSNEFGSVYQDRIAFNVKKGWFSGGILEEFPVRHVTSIRSEVTRKAVLGIILIIVGLVAFQSGGGGVMLGVLLVALGAFFLMGSPSVTINTAGGERRTSAGTPFQRAAGEDYAAAVRQVLFST
ncbi:hypothetical protein [Sphingomonas sp.]|uniref:hypothetical protein n=1 Tax=Sphingomonas sp. TaxID=28214 RepID=UPI002FCC5008